MENAREKTAAVVLAAGKGKRMNSDIPKQYMMLREKPVIYYALKAFEDSFIDEIILVTEQGEEAYCREEIVERYQFTKVRKIVPGGAERYFSVRMGWKPFRRTVPIYLSMTGPGPLSQRRFFRLRLKP